MSGLKGAQISFSGDPKMKWMIKRSVFMICLGLFFFSPLTAYAWKVPIEVAMQTGEGEKVFNKLVVGIESGATDRFDNLWDAPALLPQPDPGTAVFFSACINGKTGKGGEAGDLWKDIRGAIAKGDVTWEITVDSVPPEGSVIVRWSVPQGALKSGERLVLKDHGKLGSDGEPVKTDAAQTTQYEFVPDAGGSRSLSLTFSKDESPAGSVGGIGCGTTHFPGGRSPGDGAGVLAVVVIFSPLWVIRLIRLIRLTPLR